MLHPLPLPTELWSYKTLVRDIQKEIGLRDIAAFRQGEMASFHLDPEKFPRTQIEFVMKNGSMELSLNTADDNVASFLLSHKDELQKLVLDNENITSLKIKRQEEHKDQKGGQQQSQQQNQEDYDEETDG